MTAIMPPPLRFLLAARRSELHGLEALARTCDLVIRIGRLVHALQKERGASNLYLSGGDAGLLPMLAALRADAQDIEHEAREFLGRLEPDASRATDNARLLNGIAYALYRLDELPGLRARIRQRHIDAEDASQRFTALIASLLAIVFEAADSSLDPGITRTLVALLNFMQGKELCGQERAYGVMGYTAGYFSDARKSRMREFADSQARCFAVFEQYAPPALMDAWRELRQTHDDELGRMRGMVARTSESQPLDPSLATLWFDLCTARIDAMHGVETRLAQALASQCEARIAEMRDELRHHGRLLDVFAGRDADRPDTPPAMLFNVQGRILGAPPPDGVGSDMERSLLDMLQEQTLRMQRANDALSEMRGLLDERRRIEKAKWVLAGHYRLSEQDAHERLQKMAMDNRLPLTEVARQVLAELGKDAQDAAA
ncbi:antitermination regulator [Bordetella genomosp. 9]|uniref:nitrate- and nitrite sensing domain-containing protein n=1 Tax=Bordetella genomosp. 9 TaxID=1416803 RepID=UPI000A293127|nr:nitrate- and nitrite sensing domain-containing protein [Bordetella genomosp. 9]ARP91523.1 antitermination regulator [Bordetella genomosp. 9]